MGSAGVPFVEGELNFELREDTSYIWNRSVVAVQFMRRALESISILKASAARMVVVSRNPGATSQKRLWQQSQGIASTSV